MTTTICDCGVRYVMGTNHNCPRQKQADDAQVLRALADLGTIWHITDERVAAIGRTLPLGSAPSEGSHVSSADDRLRAAILTGGSDPIHMDGTRCPPDHACVHRDMERLTSELEEAKGLLREVVDGVLWHGASDCGAAFGVDCTCHIGRIRAFLAHPKGPEPADEQPQCRCGVGGEHWPADHAPATPAQGESRR